MTQDALEHHAARRVTADAKPGYPCRVSLQDAEPGDELVLVNYEHQSGRSPYRASHAVFVRKGATQARPDPGAVPQVLQLRLLSLRGFDHKDMMIAADVIKGRDAAAQLKTMLSDPAVDYIHIHYAKPGCFAARVTRV
nr:DUF1203 domain-containing protein [Pseudaestuariivita rosea]